MSTKVVDVINELTCPYCGSGFVDTVDTEFDSSKYQCRDCGKDYICWYDFIPYLITDRNNHSMVVRSGYEWVGD